MTAVASLEALERLYAERGHSHYGEGVSQLEHALQCGSFAEARGAAPALVAAALLHDVGHLLLGEEEQAENDLRHEVAGARALARLFGPDVVGPIALHVAAKRWLCLTEPAYLDALSPASRRSLALQGGPFTAAQARVFETSAFWREAVALRRIDDEGKRAEPCGRVFADFAPVLRSLAN